MLDAEYLHYIRKIRSHRNEHDCTQNYVCKHFCPSPHRKQNLLSDGQSIYESADAHSQHKKRARPGK